MEYKFIVVSGLFLGFLIGGFVICITEIEKLPIKKDCQLVNISPDFTPKEKELCRKMLMVKPSTRL